jgi:hypothetical protein
MAVAIEPARVVADGVKVERNAAGPFVRARGVAERLRGAGALTDVVRLALREGRCELREDVLLGCAAALAEELVADVVDRGEGVHRRGVAVVGEVDVRLRVTEGDDPGPCPSGRAERDVDRCRGDARNDRADRPVDVVDRGRGDELVHDRVRDDPATRGVGRAEGRLAVAPDDGLAGLDPLRALVDRGIAVDDAGLGVEIRQERLAVALGLEVELREVKTP